MSDQSNQPSTPPTTDAVIAALVGLYSLAEVHLLMGASEILKKLNFTLLTITPAMSAVEIAQRIEENDLKLSVAMPKIRRTSERLVIMLGQRSPALVDALVNVARREASVAAGLASDFTLPLGEETAERIRKVLNVSLQDTQRQVLRWPEDLFKALTLQTGIRPNIRDDLTVAQVQAQSFSEFTAHGVTGFVDKAGRNWNLASYVEMATRSAASRIFNDAHLATMRALGVELFTVDHDLNPCELCFPWQGRVLSATPDERADATIEEAAAAGLFHNNCRHVLIKWVQGVHPPAGSVAKRWTQADKDRYDASQRKRRLQRQIQQQKLQASIAIDATTHKAALARVRANQAALRLLKQSELLPV